MGILLAVAMLLILTARPQGRVLTYSIKKGGDEVGTMNVREVKAGTQVRLRMEMEVKTSFIFTLSAKGMEEAVFEKGLLLYSSFYQKVNGAERVNKQLRWAGGSYTVQRSESRGTLANAGIYYNMVCLYTFEPSGVSHVYTDKFERLVPIQKVEDHQYKIRFPDGNYNEYYYENGTCNKATIHHSFYSVVMELKPEH